MSDRTSQIIRKLSRVNTYVVVVVFFLFITFVVGDSNLYKRYTYDEKIRRLEREIRHYKKEIETDRKKLDDIRTNREGLERYAREEFYMKRANEDVFIIED
ncbi:septum formation initiator [Tannerella serpentiformis]|mgnify:FL=1|jgi:septum formation initiator protein|uniref:Septum formation initiator n=2 Tax=Tannerella serpentiformis TaxID=712710 RepID=W2CDI3_9BACT|nr:septum formation initiator family protein [Tannerella serpentiformis]AOH40309.1 septum formation initiator [Tannerella serpentiformis]AVV54214.1 septum formation initiator [Tannerella serpentiformis]ETK01122.1 septum formation initiator [Tannerella sp. oral taxon BU063 isolate Cell 2]ETK04561.1 septum formation initiator [Tannerella sp. oral taxon BU063 isolate Cell 5]